MKGTGEARNSFAESLATVKVLFSPVQSLVKQSIQLMNRSIGDSRIECQMVGVKKILLCGTLLWHSSSSILFCLKSIAIFIPEIEGKKPSSCVPMLLRNLLECQRLL